MEAGKRKAARKSPTKRRTVRRRRNPKIGGISVRPAAVEGLGIAIGAYFGGAITAVVDQYLVSRLPAGFARALGFGAAGVGSLMLGEYLSKRVEGLPVRSAMAGVSVPMWLEAFRSIDWLPTTAVQEAMEGRRRRRRMRGTIQPGALPGGMMGTIQAGPIPGGMMGSGRFGALLS